MAKILLDYVFPISVVEPTPAASTAFLRQVCVVAKPAAGQEGNVGTIYECTSMAQVAEKTDNENAEQLFAAGMNRVFILLSDDLDIGDALLTEVGEFWTVLISDDFDDDDLGDVTVPAVAASLKIQDILYTARTPGVAGNSITITYADTNTGGAASASSVGSALTVSIEDGVTPASAIAAAIAGDVASNALVITAVDAGDETDPQAAVTATNLASGADDIEESGTVDVGTFEGVVAFSSEDADVADLFATPSRRVGFFRGATGGAGNMFFAFGNLLSNRAKWANQQYIEMPFNDGIASLGEANALFDDRVSFVLTDEEYGNRLAFFVAGGKAIAEPYISKNLRIDVQSQAMIWIAANQPDYTIVNAGHLETNIQEKVIQRKYIDQGMITDGLIEITLVQDNFVANGFVNITEPKALWRIFGTMQSTL